MERTKILIAKYKKLSQINAHKLGARMAIAADNQKHKIFKELVEKWGYDEAKRLLKGG